MHAHTHTHTQFALPSTAQRHRLSSPRPPLDTCRENPGTLATVCVSPWSRVSHWSQSGTAPVDTDTQIGKHTHTHTHTHTQTQDSKIKSEPDRIIVCDRRCKGQKRTTDKAYPLIVLQWCKHQMEELCNHLNYSSSTHQTSRYISHISFCKTYLQNALTNTRVTLFIQHTDVWKQICSRAESLQWLKTGQSWDCQTKVIPVT